MHSNHRKNLFIKSLLYGSILSCASCSSSNKSRMLQHKKHSPEAPHCRQIQIMSDFFAKNVSHDANPIVKTFNAVLAPNTRPAEIATDYNPTAMPIYNIFNDESLSKLTATIDSSANQFYKDVRSIAFMQPFVLRNAAFLYLYNAAVELAATYANVIDTFATTVKEAYDTYNLSLSIDKPLTALSDPTYVAACGIRANLITIHNAITEFATLVNDAASGKLNGEEYKNFYSSSIKEAFIAIVKATRIMHCAPIPDAAAQQFLTTFRTATNQFADDVHRARDKIASTERTAVFIRKKTPTSAKKQPFRSRFKTTMLTFRGQSMIHTYLK